MERCVPLWVLCLMLLGLGLMQSDAFEVEVKDSSNHTCIRASLMVNFTVQYETTSNSSKNASFSAPNAVTTNGSFCGNDSIAPLLLVNFGNGHSWSLNFTKNSTIYSSDVLTFTYNLSDSTYFQGALTQGLINSTANVWNPVPLNRTYKCVHDEIVASVNVTQLIWNVTLQAFVQNDTFGQEFICDADKHTTAAPTTPNVTTIAPTTPNFTTPAPTPKPVDKPSVGSYSVSNGTGKCLLASMGLQLNVSLTVEGKNVSVLLNINPNTTRSSGTCGNETATLTLNDTKLEMTFDFEIKKNNFRLQKLAVTLDTGSARLSRTVQNLTFWEASVGSSYLCHKEQIISVSEDLHVNTFDVRVQPFGVHNETYATADECSLDDDSLLVPIVVGAALAGLIVIILIAYLSAEDCKADQNFTIPIVVGAVLAALIILVTVAYLIGRKRHQSAGYEQF